MRVNPLFVRRKDDDENYNVVEKIKNSRNFLARLEGEENRSAENWLEVEKSRNLLDVYEIVEDRRKSLKFVEEKSWKFTNFIKRV